MLTYHYTKRVGFDDVDYAGIVFFPRVLEYTHDGVQDLLEELEYTIDQRDDGVAFPVVSAHADYHAPLEYRDVVDVELTLTTGESSLTFEAVGSTDGDTAFESRLEHAVVSRDSFSRADLPAPLLERIEQYPD